jgi:hypothetical protein
VRLILRKDLRVLARTPALAAALLVYPLVIAILVGLVAGYASSKPRVALVDEDNLPARIVVGNRTFDVGRTIDTIASNVTLVHLSAEDASRQLDEGKVVAVVTVPPGFVATLRAMTRSPTLDLAITSGGTSGRVRQQVQALVYSLNRKLQRAYIDANIEYVHLLLHGGSGHFLGKRFEVLGLDGTKRELDALPRTERLDRIREFVRTARLALAQTDDALRATAAPIQLREEPSRGRAAALSAEVQGWALALTVTFIALVLAAVAGGGGRGVGLGRRRAPRGGGGGF